MKEYRIIGQGVPRLDAKELVTGKAKYSRDIVLPMMLQGKILRSPYPYARILRIDTGPPRSTPFLPPAGHLVTRVNELKWVTSAL